MFSYQGHHHEAIEVLKNFLELFDNQANSKSSTLACAEVFYQLGQAYEGLDDLENARASYEQALAIDPEHYLTTEALMKMQIQSDLGN